MSLIQSINNPDSLQILLQKAHAINTVNHENLTFIESRKGQQVIIKHKYSLQIKPPPAKKQKLQQDDMFTLFDNKATKNVNDIISSWRYTGEALTKEKIAIDDFMHRKLERYGDLIRLKNEYDRLLNQYERLLADEPESRIAVEVVLRNVELLQVAIGDIHLQVLDEVDSEKVNDAMTSLMHDLSRIFQVFQSKVSGVSCNIQGQIGEESKEGGILEFRDIEALTCTQTLSQHESAVFALESYIISNETFLLSAGDDRNIQHWNLSNNSLVATLTGHNHAVVSLAVYVKNGMYMLASGSFGLIKIWDLSSNTNVHTLRGHDLFIYSLIVYEKDDQMILISGNHKGTIKVWDLKSYNVIRTIHKHEHPIRALNIYTQNDRSYLASGSWDKNIHLWSLVDDSLIKTIDAGDPINSLVVVNVGKKKILASADVKAKVKLWSLDDYKCIDKINLHSNTSFVIRLNLNVLQCNDKEYLISAGCDRTIKIWDLGNVSIVKVLDNDSLVRRTRVVMNGGEACLAIGDDAGKVKLWME